jgi:hypothetical protein
MQLISADAPDVTVHHGREFAQVWTPLSFWGGKIMVAGFHAVRLGSKSRVVSQIRNKRPSDE